MLITGRLKVTVYEGVRRSKVTAAELAGYDTVLTTYDELSEDIWHNPDGESAGRQLRHKKRYKVSQDSQSSWNWWSYLLRCGTVFWKISSSLG